MSTDIAGNLPKRSPDQPAARFKLFLRSGQEPQAVITDIRREFAPLNVKVEPPSDSQHGVLILRFPVPMTAEAFDRFNLMHVEACPIWGCHPTLTGTEQ